MPSAAFDHSVSHAPTESPRTEKAESASSGPVFASVPLLMVPVARLTPSPLNPRQHFDKHKLEDLAATMGNGVGVIEPLVVRNGSANRYEIVAGERRWRAAKIAQLEEVPVVVKTLTDAQVLELMVIENNEREDLNALEEGEGFRRLLKFGFDLDKLAARISRSRKYIYDRIKLHDLIPPAKALVLEGRITAGHGILIARLKPEQQQKVLGLEKRGGYHDPLEGALFEQEHTLWNPNETEADRRVERKDPYAGMKVRSVRELQAYIDKHFRFVPSDSVNVELFPATQTAIEQAEKVVSITYDHHVLPEAKEGTTERVYSTVSWKRADGQLKSKTCDVSVTGVVAVGPGRGEAFKVCVDKACDVHWKQERLHEARQQKVSTRSATSLKAEQERRELQQRREEAARKGWEAATPAILEAVAAKLKAAPVAVLAASLLRGGGPHVKAAQLLKAGKSAEDVLRVLLLTELMDDCRRYWSRDAFIRAVKPFKVDVAGIVKKHTAQASGEKNTGTDTTSAQRGRRAKKS